MLSAVGRDMAFSDVLAAIRSVTTNPREQAALAYACGAESGCQSIQNAAGAPAYGPWQIFLPLNSGVTVAQANDPAYAATYMYGHHNVAGCTAAQGNTWITDPHAAELAAARCIEGATPAEPYSTAQQTAGQQNADPLLNGGTVVTQPVGTIGMGNAGGSIPVLSGIGDAVGGVAGGVQGIGSLAGSVAGIAGLFGKAFDALSSPDFWVSILLVFGGGLLAIIGAAKLAGGNGRAQQAAQIAGTAAIA